MINKIYKKLFKPILLLFVITTIIFLFQNQQQKNLVRDIGNDLANYGSFKNRVHNTKLSINKNTITIKMDIFDNFDSLPSIHQFAFMKFFVSQMRYTLKNLQDKNNYLSYNIKIESSTQSHRYKYISNVISSKPNNQFEYASAFSKDDTHIMSFEEYKTELKKTNPELTISETENEIIDYGEKLFSLLTSNGRYYRPESDIQLIEDIVCEKYSLSSEEYLTIYRKAFVLNQ